MLYHAAYPKLTGSSWPPDLPVGITTTTMELMDSNVLRDVVLPGAAESASVPRTPHCNSLSTQEVDTRVGIPIHDDDDELDELG